MSQVSSLLKAGGGGSGTVVTLTGNSGGAVGPDGSGNINVLGAGDISIAGNAGTNTLTVSLSGAEANSFVTDAGTATPATGVLNVVGGNNIDTAGSGDTVTINVSGTTNHAVQIGNATNSLTSLAVGTTGEVLTASTAADPAFAALGTNSGLTQHGVLLGQNNGAITATAVGTTNTVLLGNTGADPSYGQVPNAALVNDSITIAAGTNITVTGSPVALGGTVTISASSSTLLDNYTNVSTSPYVVLATDYYLSVDSSGGAIQINLPNAPTTNQIFIIKDRTGSAAAHNITITTVGGIVDIDGATSVVMNTNYESKNVVFNGTSFEIW